MKKIITIVGARPQFVKAATLSRQFQIAGIDEKIIHTGQHFDANMSEVFFREMEIPKPAYQLDIHGVSHGAMTGRMLEGIEKILLNEKPDGILVYGDTNSTLAGALAAAKLHIPVVHVEAGLRSFNMAMPEEINRILTDRISTALFCPTDTAIRNLKNEGFDNMPVQIFKNGDVMQDAAMYYAGKAQLKSDIVRKIGIRKFILGTIHRQENTDNPENLKNIIAGLTEINKEIPVVVPMHPRTRNILAQTYKLPDFTIIEPVGYFDMIMLLKSCDMVITDSGGVQKEAYFFGKHCITLREQTEWTELVENGFNILTGSDTQKLKEAYEFFKTKTSDFSIDLYGNGKAAEKAVEEIRKL
ncbi:MAG: UDP-N-acetylglucosamine 2-epimerase (non-hydrolyzing) [Paludibacter sp.]|jgi:UDP-GlcNAc3NAcA epimerase|nr:UDP-N-acetylglucosamine 2-epimerase (non-hydrolyzing) [Paludibacter sp.]